MAAWTTWPASLRRPFFCLFAVVVLAVPAGANPSTQAPLCAESAQQAEQARALVQKGLDAALIEHTTRLFRVWLSIGVQGRENAARGVTNEVRGWLWAQHVVSEWTIPICK